VCSSRAYGLGFVAVAREPYDLVCDAAALRDPALAPLWALLGDGAFRASITALGGYDVAETGRRVR
jgi:putative molybdopterin biosynthesis protein